MRPEDLPKTSVQELRRLLSSEGLSLSAECEAALASDPRSGARAVHEAIQKQRAKDLAEDQRLDRLLEYETRLWAAGRMRVAGVDEAGVGPLAGPVVAAAVILPRDYRPRGIDDSKKIDASLRERLAADIKRSALSYSVAMAQPEEIDAINIYRASLLAMRRAIEGLSLTPDHLLLDARKIPEMTIPQDGIIRGDSLSLTIAASSILAKTARDALMAELDQRYPGYGLARHKGYPTTEHVAALKKLGASPIHRRSFAPVREVLENPVLVRA